MTKNIAIVITTIYKYSVVDELLSYPNLYVIGDKKTPISVPQINLISQRDWLRDHPKLKSIIPYNTDARRNIGYLMALQDGADIVISMDDDNYPTGDINEYIRQHSITGSLNKSQEIESSTKWFNICDILENDKKVNIYPRGFPYYARIENKIKVNIRTRKIAINQGLWFESPDVDAITNLVANSSITGMATSSMILSKNTWSPINSQNTAVSKKAMYSYMFMIGFKRFGDILQGYLARKCIDQMGEYVRYGTPLVNHRRNAHNYLKDMLAETPEMLMIEETLPWLRGMQLESKSYAECYNELASKLPKTRYWNKIARYMNIWVDEVDDIVS